MMSTMRMDITNGRTLKAQFKRVAFKMEINREYGIFIKEISVFILLINIKYSTTIKV